ncbi:MAG: ribose-phosphate diphosphokinase, partial [Planctomycetes bacterium]|nr:ribose-phosphate diphosphokinase [Planctomycetota bacterium]
VLVSPDVGGIKMVRSYAKKLQAPLAIVDKRRTGPRDTEAVHIIGDVKGKNAIMVDDMVATGGTIAQAARILKAQGAKDIYLCATHPVLAGSAVEKLSKAPIKEAVFTDTIPFNQPDKKKIIKILSVAGLISEAIRRIHNSESVSSLFV